MSITRIHDHDNGVQSIRTNQLTNIGTNKVFVSNIPNWLTDHPNTTVPNHPPATVLIGQPIINMPGCVEAHEQSDKNNEIIIFHSYSPAVEGLYIKYLGDVFFWKILLLGI